MKSNSKIFTGMCALFLCFASCCFGQQLNKEDRKNAIVLLKQTQSDLLIQIETLSKAQMLYKPDSSSWSIAECVAHLSLTEEAFFNQLQLTLKAPAQPKKNTQMDNTQFIAIIKDRSNKVKTSTVFEPKSLDYEVAVSNFKNNRTELLQFMKKTKASFYDHFYAFPFGDADAYLLVLFLASHTERHLAQIKEIQSNSTFPM